MSKSWKEYFRPSASSWLGEDPENKDHHPIQTFFLSLLLVLASPIWFPIVVFISIVAIPVMFLFEIFLSHSAH